MSGEKDERKERKKGKKLFSGMKSCVFLLFEITLSKALIPFEPLKLSMSYAYIPNVHFCGGAGAFYYPQPYFLG